MNKKRIANRLKSLRKGKSVREVAKDVGISPSALCMYEAGLRVPRDDIKVRLAVYYGETVASIFFG